MGGSTAWPIGWSRHEYPPHHRCCCWPISTADDDIVAFLFQVPAHVHKHVFVMLKITVYDRKVGCRTGQHAFDASGWSSSTSETLKTTHPMV